jgi:hypothetical protein
MKNQILLFLCIIAFTTSFGQTAPAKSFSAANIGDIKSKCNCYQFNVDQELYPFHPPNTQIPGYSYFWIWGDGSYTDAESPTSIRCFNGPANSSYNVQLELTPRKRPGDPTVSENTTIITEDSCSDTPLNYGDLEIDISRVIKIGKYFYIILETKGCPTGVSNFSLDYDEGSLAYSDHLPSLVSYFDNGTAITFDQTDDAILTHYLKFECLSSAIHGSEVEFLVQKTSLVDSNCNESASLLQTITGGPYDPNILAPSLGRGLTDCDISDKWITYNLQFKNEGSGPTVDSVKVLINLDDRLIKDSFEILEVRNFESVNWTRRLTSTSMSNGDFTLAGNPSSWESAYNSTNIVGVKCYYMKLEGRSAAVESNSYGYVSFKVKVKPNTVLAPGDSLVTNAQVYFDDVAPMPTNLAVTSCSLDDVGPCRGNRDCCCNKCCSKPWYINYIWGLIGAFCGLVLFFWFRNRKKY